MRNAFNKFQVLILFLAMIQGSQALFSQNITARLGKFEEVDIVCAPLLPVTQGTASIVGTAGNGTYFYWVVANYAAGNSTPYGPIAAFNAPSTLSASNYIALNWATAPGATTYDVLRTTTPTLPNGPATIAVITATSTTGVNDQGGALSSYTITTFNPGLCSTFVNGNIGGALKFTGNNTHSGTETFTGSTFIGNSSSSQESIFYRTGFCGNTGPSASLCMLVSKDGIHWGQVSGGVLYSAPGSDVVRDASILDYGGNYYVAYTRLFSGATSWGLATSIDLQNWSHVQDTPANVTGVTDTWAPEFFQDSDGSVYVLYAVSTNNEVSFSIYASKATNTTLTTWDTPVQLLDTTDNPIDPFLVLSAGTYYLFFNDDTTGNTMWATSSSVRGTYTVQGTTGLTLQSISIVQLANGNWRMYGTSSANPYYSDSSSLSNASWPTVTAIYATPSPEHGTVRRTNDHKIEAALAAMGSAPAVLKFLFMGTNGSGAPAIITESGPLWNQTNDFYISGQGTGPTDYARFVGGTQQALFAGSIGVGSESITPTLQLQVQKAIGSGLNTVTFSTTPTFDASLGNTQRTTLTGNVTSSTLSNAVAGESLNFNICQDATGSRTFVWPTNVLNPPTINSTASSCTYLSGTFDGTNLQFPSVYFARNVQFNGSTSGQTTVVSQAVASGTLTLPATTDTLTGKATTDTFTNKTLDTAGAGNVLKINGTQVSAVTGTGSVVLATSPSLTTPSLGAATATSLTGLTGAFTPNAAGGTDVGSASLPFANYWLGGAATNNAKLTGTFTAARIFTVPDTASDTFTLNAATQTLTNKYTLNQQTSAATNFGTALASQTIAPSGNVTANSSFILTIVLVQSTLGVGCGAGTNTVTPTFSYTAPGGTAQTTVGTALSISANGTLDTQQADEVVVAVKSGTAVTYTTASTLASAGCTTTPQYTAYGKAS